MTPPRIPIMSGWGDSIDILKEEVNQSLEEGRDPIIVAKLEQKIANIDPNNREGIEDLWQQFQHIPQKPNYPYVEPNDLAAIQSERPNGPRRLPLPYGDDVLFDRMNGAWQGRAAGCALGKPVECFMLSNATLTSRKRIERYLTAIAPEEYPIRDYIPGKSPASAETGETDCKASTRESISFMESDDDIRYTVIGQIIMRKHGAGFTTRNVAVAWMNLLGYGLVCTAETQAYRNIVIAYPRLFEWNFPESEIDWSWVATHHNPYREWIGAQIRADSWGYAAPGNPELAADFAWRDARMTHVKNGIYGEMFCAAMIAAGFATQDPLEVVEAALAEIPKRSRLHKDIRDTIAICREHGNRASEFEAVFGKIEALLGHYHAVHTNNNAALVVAALLLGRDDFEKTIAIAVMGGWDTDCNGATAGSIWGAMHGASRIPAKWISPLHDTLYSLIPDYHPIAISECARKSVEIAITTRAM